MRLMVVPRLSMTRRPHDAQRPDVHYRHLRLHGWSVDRSSQTFPSDSADTPDRTRPVQHHSIRNQGTLIFATPQPVTTATIKQAVATPNALTADGARKCCLPCDRRWPVRKTGLDSSNSFSPTAKSEMKRSCSEPVAPSRRQPPPVHHWHRLDSEQLLDAEGGRIRHGTFTYIGKVEVKQQLDVLFKKLERPVLSAISHWTAPAGRRWSRIPPPSVI